MNQSAFKFHFFGALDDNNPFSKKNRAESLRGAIALLLIPFFVYFFGVAIETEFSASTLFFSWLIGVEIALLEIVYRSAMVGWHAKRCERAGYNTIDRSPGYFAKHLTVFDRFHKQLMCEHIDDDDERIVASANLDDSDGVWYVLCPGRHHHVIWFMAQHGMNKRIVDQGFLTNKYRYLDREAARAMAMRNGQCPTPDHSVDLFSEDLWSIPPYLAQKE
jgi:hypothetical protein